jgi:hypothetical protein
MDELTISISIERLRTNDSLVHNVRCFKRVTQKRQIANRLFPPGFCHSME